MKRKRRRKLSGRGDEFAQGAIVAMAVTASGARGLDWEQVAGVVLEWATFSDRRLAAEGERTRSYRQMQALVAIGLFEIVGDTTNSPVSRQRVRRIRVGQ